MFLAQRCPFPSFHPPLLGKDFITHSLGIISKTLSITITFRAIILLDQTDPLLIG